MRRCVRIYSMKQANWTVTVLLLAFPLCAQTYTALDGTTPPSLAAGTPSGSYVLSGFESMNLYNGNLNFALPLYHVEGRGDSGYTMILPLQMNWHAERRIVNTNDGSYILNPHYGSSWSPPRYSPGIVTGRTIDDLVTATYDCGGPVGVVRQTGYVLTRLTFVSGDGTEHELRDQSTGGQPKYPTSTSGAIGCADPVGTNRGKVFTSADGSAMTFISDADVVDNPSPTPPRYIYPTGWLFFPNGVRYRVSSSRITQIIDRNGNTVTITYPVGSASITGMTVKDAQDRTITVIYADTAGLNGPATTDDVITYPAYGYGSGSSAVPATRTVRVRFGLISSVLASGQTPTTPALLFPSLNGDSANNFNPYMPVKVILPNSAEYNFTYNSYGELAGVTLPTGGGFQYEWTARCPASAPNCDTIYTGDEYNERVIARYVKKRVVLSSPGVTEKTVYYTPAYAALADTLYPSRSSTIVTVEHRQGSDLAGSLLSKQKHYFLGDLSDPTAYMSSPNIFYPRWWDGQEFKTEEYRDQTNVERKTQQTFGQRACSASLQPCWYTPTGGDPAGDYTPARDVYVCQSASTWVPTSQTSTQILLYDKYNNLTDRWEYDYGSGPSIAASCPAAPSSNSGYTRHFITNYLASIGSVVYDAYAPTDTTRSDPAQAPVSIHVRNFPTSQLVKDSADGFVSRADHAVDEADRTPQAASGITEHLASYGTSFTTRANPTRIRAYADSSTYIDFRQSFDIGGNVVSTVDGNGNTATADYSCGFLYRHSITKGGLTNTTNWDCTSGKPTSLVDPNLVTTTLKYEDPLQRLTQVIRADGKTEQNQTTYKYCDPGAACSPANSATAKSDRTSFNDNALPTMSVFDGLGRTTETRQYLDANTSGNNYIATLTNYDAMGRTWKSSNPGDTNNWTETLYDFLGRTLTVTAPGGATTYSKYGGNKTTVRDPAGKWRSTTTDALGRLTSVVEDPTDNIAVGTTTYSNTSAVDPPLATYYVYDGLDDLKLVCQGGTLSDNTSNATCTGGQSRSFAYDGLKRLTSATNPETNTIIYAYLNGSSPCAGDPSLPCAKMDHRNVVTVFQYDALNRVTQKFYNDGTATVSYTYDAHLTSPPTGLTSYPKGRLTAVTNSSSQTKYDAYDALGRVTYSTQKTEGVSYTFGNLSDITQPGYEYNLAGALTKMRLPSGKMVSYAYDGAGRVNYADVTAPGASVPKTYASQVNYWPHGGIQTMSYGDGSRLWEYHLYNNRLQTTEIGLGTTAGTTAATPANLGTVATDYSQLRLQFGYFDPSTQTAAVNNGNVVSEAIRAAKYDATTWSATQNFVYEPLNRLQTASEGNLIWKQEYGYDGYGNRAVKSGTLPNAYIADSSQTTQVSTMTAATVAARFPNNQSDLFVYDAGGNNAGLTGASARYCYDAENRLIYTGSSASCSTVSVTGYFAYDGDGRRVKKATPSGYTWYVYDAMGELAAEYTPNVTNANGATLYLTPDHLGSTRMVTDSQGAVISRHDYLPFGEEIDSSLGQRSSVPGYTYTADRVTVKFTGKERDVETGLDYFGARYLSSAQGRWMSPDWSGAPEPVPFADLTDPQTLNLYGYVRNNPLTHADLDGHCTIANPISCWAYIGNVPKAAPPVAAGALITPVVATLGVIGNTMAVLGEAYYIFQANKADKVGLEQQDKLIHQENEEKLTRPEPEPATDGAGAMKGGGRDPKRFFDRKTKEDKANEADNKCVMCGRDTTKPKKSERGVTPPGTDRATDHITAWAKRGRTTPNNAQNLCRDCNQKKGDKEPPQ